MKSKFFFKYPQIAWCGMAIILALLALTVTPALARSATKKVTVPATTPWYHTRIQITAGQVVKIEAQGKASTLVTSKGSRSGPNGQKFICGAEPPAPPPCALTGARYGALVAKIGNQPAFLVGKKLTFTAKSSGILYLSVNDNLRWYADNAGGYTVVVKTP